MKLLELLFHNNEQQGKLNKAFGFIEKDHVISCSDNILNLNTK